MTEFTKEELDARKAEWKAQEDVNAAFNAKWADHLKEGHYGMDIGNPEVSAFVSKEFESLKLLAPDFKYLQIKLKFGKARVYLESESLSFGEVRIFESSIEEGINKLI